jgi:predicted permease
MPARFFQFPWRTRSTIERDLDSELEFHLDARVAELIAQGVPAEEARRRARDEFGDLEFTRRYCRDLDLRSERTTRLADRLAAWRQDVRYAGRTLRKSPGFALVSIVTLALAIGANTAIYSVARSVLFAPLPYGEPGALVSVFGTSGPGSPDHYDLSPPDLVDYRAQQHSFTGVAAYIRRLTTWRPADGNPQILNAMEVTANLFPVLRVGAWRGRTFVTGDDTQADGAKAVLSYQLWERELGADPSIVGRTITLDNHAITVIGIMPRGFVVNGDEDLWLPLDLSPMLAKPEISRKQHWLRTIARLAPGVSLAAGRAEMGTIGRRLQQAYPDAGWNFVTTVAPLRETVAGNLQRPVLLLLGAAGLVLLIACANLANVSLSRTVSRRTEIGIRAALGAGRGRLARQLLTESTLLAVIGGALGVLLAVLGTRALLALNPATLPPLFHPSVDGWVLGFSLLLSIATGIASGLVPALSATRDDLHGALKDQGRSGTGGRGSDRIRGVLVVAQVGLAVMLLVAAGLLTRSFGELSRVDLGFDPNHVLTAQLRADGPQYDSAAAVNRFYDQVLDEIGRAPGVVAAGATMFLPTQGSVGTVITVEGSGTDPVHPPDIGHSIVRGAFFRAMSVPLLAGRLFDDTDRPDGPEVAIVNQIAARLLFPGGQAVGRKVHIGPNPNAPWLTVVGVVGDMRDRGVDHPVAPMIFLCGRQQTWWRSMSVAVRMVGDPRSMAEIVRRATRNADPTLAVRDLQPLDHVIGSSLAGRRFGLALAAAFAGLALLLAAVGIYGVLAYSVTSRTREFGVRLALGASTRSVLALVLRQGIGWSLVGLALGVAGALAAGRLLTTMLYGVGPMDLATYLAVAGGLLVVVVISCLVPALRATSVDPLTSTRAE